MPAVRIFLAGATGVIGNLPDDVNEIPATTERDSYG
jgi:hypothetical protein